METGALRKTTEAQDSIIGQVFYHRNLISPQLKQLRDIVVWVPTSYQHNPEARYPVLYAHDGQNLFDPITAFAGHDWRLDETATNLIDAGKVGEFLIVGIYNTPDRTSEYSGSSIGKKYASFVANELKPFIDNTYRTKQDAMNTGVMGASMGGLISFLMAWWFPDIFGKAACVSSSFFWNKDKVLKMVRDYRGAKKPLRIYLDVGSQETLLTEGYQQMVKLLGKQGYRKGVDLQYFFDRGGDHNERDWGNRAWRALTFLFKKPRKRKAVAY
jgi:enterochelin esterase-like enzyme